MNGPILLIFAISLAMAAIAVALMLRIKERTRRSNIQLRARALLENGTDFPAFSTSDGNFLIRATTNLLGRSGVDISVERVTKILWVFLASLLIAWLVLGFFSGTVLMTIAALSFYALLAKKADLHRAKILEQLPAFLDGIIRILSAGNSLEEAIGVSARESPEPLRSLFVTVGRQVRLGAPVEVVLQEAASVHRLRDIQVMALAAAINRKYGGSLQAVLRSLVLAIRSRDVAARELRALTAETRFSAIVLGVIPIALSLFIYSRNRDYYASMWVEPSGKALLILSILLQISGILVLWRMMRNAESGDS